jgi:CheY-like chemotaxis protein
MLVPGTEIIRDTSGPWRRRKALRLLHHGSGSRRYFALRPEPTVHAVGHMEWGIAMSERPLVAVVDDSDSVRESLPGLLEQVGFGVQAFASAEAFLASGAADTTDCLVLDVGLPGMSGPDLQQELIRRGAHLPVVFITAQGDRALRPRLLAAGAVACLFKPFSDTALIEAVQAALGTR